MSEFLAILFIFFTVVLYKLTRKDKFDAPLYAKLRELDMEERVQQEALDKMWVSYILHVQQGLISGIATVTLIEWLMTL